MPIAKATYHWPCSDDYNEGENSAGLEVCPIVDRLPEPRTVEDTYAMDSGRRPQGSVWYCKQVTFVSSVDVRPG
jgi:hypothetical protein